MTLDFRLQLVGCSNLTSLLKIWKTYSKTLKSSPNLWDKFRKPVNLYSCFATIIGCVLIPDIPSSLEMNIKRASFKPTRNTKAKWLLIFGLLTSFQDNNTVGFVAAVISTTKTPVIPLNLSGEFFLVSLKTKK